jgi:hypothetical protein
VTPFFIPGAKVGATERAYAEMRRSVELDTGVRATKRRIRELWSRRGGTDCRTEVGRPDPVHGDMVLAIFDLGPHQPFVVHRQSPDGPGSVIICEVLSAHAYAVTEFES